MSKNDQSTEQLTPKQYELIELLLSGIAIAAAARQLKVSDKTARRWTKLPHFQDAYKQAQQSLFDQALTGLMRKVDKAIETLDRNMDADINTPASTQVRAAQIVLEQAINVHKMSELEARLAELEERLKGR